MAEQQEPSKTYRGNCHCAAFVYEITLPEIKQASECNCSICYKKAAIWVFPKPSDVKYVKGDPSKLTSYTFHEKKFTHKHCPTCGVSLSVVGHLTPPKPGEDKEPENGFNIRTFQHGQVDVWKLDLKMFDGSALLPSYEVPKYTGPQPTKAVEGGELYTGSCHCGAITVAVNSTKPFNKDLEGVVECNCSSCGRYGATWIYEPHEQIVIEGRENLGEYSFRSKTAVKKFCKICSIPICTEPAPVTEEQLAQMNEGTRTWYDKSQVVKALNLRVINGLDVHNLSRTQFDGYNFIQPGYTEP
ncbi:putative glutathione-dependent formaldehyde-activating enzyme [Rosellinia necatrix]|uniref:Putative glutathione-dependent formaldehyde-activating enzyme n=1 Tax=Rosellinia necatrix TaxID=77044 RepID=A0A1S7UH80_ROSNE|nr:putative glutathione-dependent formaldehyde-activating enzyme [Rosellinia necatrix]